jgi:1,4-dihydroxy-6-naphthoate synthase
VSSSSSTPLTDIRVAHSPDSDDAFMFWALAKNKVDAEGLNFTHHLSDIETLNREALAGTYELTAISYHAYAFLNDKYDILTCGSSVGDKYGPVLIAKTPLSQEQLKGLTIAVPGELTTAYLALKLWMPECKTEVVPFDQIMDKVADGTYQAGLIIHEGQLTYQEEGFQKIVDLGEWWYEETNLPLPLGGNAIRKDLGLELCQKIARVLQRSIEYGLAHREEALAYAKSFGRGLDDDKVDRFVGMYVNEMTLFASKDIQRAVQLLLFRAHGLGLIPTKPDVVFVEPTEVAVLQAQAASDLLATH